MYNEQTTYCNRKYLIMNEVFIACTIVWLPFIVLGLCAFVQYLRLKPERDKMEVINPFKESDKLIEHAKESYFEIMEEKDYEKRKI